MQKYSIMSQLYPYDRSHLISRDGKTHLEISFLTFCPSRRCNFESDPIIFHDKFELLDSDTGILDLSRKNLKKIPKSEDDPKLVRTLILDENELQKLENIDSFLRIEKVKLKSLCFT